MCSIRTCPFLRGCHWDMAKSAEKWWFRCISVLFGVTGVEVWCHQSLGLKGIKHALWHPTPKSHKINEKSWNYGYSDTLTDVLTCVFRCISVNLRVLPLCQEPAGFTLFFHDKTVNFMKTPKHTDYDTTVTPNWPPGDPKRSVLTSLAESGRKPPRTEMHESQWSNMTTIEHAKSREINRKVMKSSVLPQRCLNRGFNVSDTLISC